MRTRARLSLVLVIVVVLAVAANLQAGSIDPSSLAARLRHLSEGHGIDSGSCRFNGTEGSPVQLNATCVLGSLPDASVYRWDLEGDGDWDTPWIASPEYGQVWGDDFSGQSTVAGGTVGEQVEIALEAPIHEWGVITIYTWLAQSFIPSRPIVVTRIAADISINSLQPADLHVWIRDSLDVTGTNLSHGQIPYTIVPRTRFNDPKDWPVIDVDDVPLEANKTYYAMFNVLDPAPGVYEGHGVGLVEPSWPLYGGNFNIGWGQDKDDNLGFRVYSEDVVTIAEGTADVEVLNLPPSISSVLLPSAFEGSELTTSAMASDPGSDDLTFIWTFESGPMIQHVHYNDGISPDPYPSPGGTYPFTADDEASHIYGDNGFFRILLEVKDDDGGSATYDTAVTILNVPSSVTEANCTVERGTAEAWIRIAGEKWHDVRATLHKDGSEVGNVTIVRYPGSPNEQEAFLGTVDGGANHMAVLRYTPEDDAVNGQPNGASPAWIILRRSDGEEVRIHHTFNVRHPETWNWTVANLEEYLGVNKAICSATATDPGSDDLTFTWDWGDGSPRTAATYFNDGVGPDPYPSPGGDFPFSATDTRLHVYAMAGTYMVTLTVTDDDGGSTVLSFGVSLG